MLKNIDFITIIH